jgi:hypothetical protein
MAVAKPPEDKEFTAHDPSAVPTLAQHDGSCGAMTEVRHTHPIYSPMDPMHFYCDRNKGHLGIHAQAHGNGMIASWAQKR